MFQSIYQSVIIEIKQSFVIWIWKNAKMNLQKRDLIETINVDLREILLKHQMAFLNMTSRDFIHEFQVMRAQLLELSLRLGADW